MEMKKGWYHNADNSFDTVEVRYFDGTETWRYEFAQFEPNGPFPTFSEAKADAVAHYQRWVHTSRDALAMARSLTKKNPKS